MLINKNYRHLILMGLLTLLGACAKSYSVAPTGEGAQVQEGAALSIKDGHSLVTARPAAPLEKGERPSFTVAAVNAGQSSFSLGVENIKVQYNGEPVEVLSEEELVAEAERAGFLKKAWGWTKFLAITGGTVAVQAMQIKSGATPAELSPLHTEPHMQTATKMLVADMEEAEKVANTLIGEYQDSILKSQSIPAEGKHGGSFLIEKIRPKDQGLLTFTVWLGGETHTLDFQISELE